MAKNQIFKKRTFFGRGFLPCRVGGFSPNFNWTYPGSVKNFPWVRFLISHSVQKLADFSWKWANFKSWFFANFPAKTWKSAKFFFSKVTSMDNIRSLVYKIFCHAPPSGHNLQNQNPVATFEYLLQSDQELPISRNPRVFCYLRYAQGITKTPGSRLGCVVNFLSF